MKRLAVIILSILTFCTRTMNDNPVYIKSGKNYETFFQGFITGVQCTRSLNRDELETFDCHNRTWSAFGGMILIGNRPISGSHKKIFYELKERHQQQLAVKKEN